MTHRLEENSFSILGILWLTEILCTIFELWQWNEIYCFVQNQNDEYEVLLLLPSPPPPPPPLLCCFLFWSPQKVQCVFRQYLVKLLNCIGGLVECECRLWLGDIIFFFNFISFRESVCSAVGARIKRFWIPSSTPFPWSRWANTTHRPIERQRHGRPNR